MTTEMIVTLIKALVGLTAVALIVAGKWKILDKMGEKGWKALIPIYGEYLIYKHTWNGEAYFVTLVTGVIAKGAIEFSKQAEVLTSAKLAPAMTASAMVVAVVAGIATIVLLVKASYRLAKAFGHGKGYTVGLLLVEPIFTPMIGFGKSKFVAA